MIKPRKHPPPLNAIAVFEASARLLSVTRAAVELNLSQGAVSRQIQVLEERVGVALFNRRHREIDIRVLASDQPVAPPRSGRSGYSLLRRSMAGSR